MDIRKIGQYKKSPILNYGFCVADKEAYKFLVNWCEKTFGKTKSYNPRHKYPPRWAHRSKFRLSYGNFIGYGYLYFGNEDDAMAFKLMWA